MGADLLLLILLGGVYIHVILIGSVDHLALSFANEGPFLTCFLMIPFGLSQRVCVVFLGHLIVTHSFTNSFGGEHDLHMASRYYYME